MNLKLAKKLFFKLRKEGRIDVCEQHVLRDHPKRAFSVEEIVRLVCSSGTFHDTNDVNHIGQRFYWRTKDLTERHVRLVIEFEEDNQGQIILVVSAGERS